jgi:hypothetical protein
VENIGHLQFGGESEKNMHPIAPPKHKRGCSRKGKDVKGNTLPKRRERRFFLSLNLVNRKKKSQQKMDGCGGWSSHSNLWQMDVFAKAAHKQGKSLKSTMFRQVFIFFIEKQCYHAIFYVLPQGLLEGRAFLPPFSQNGFSPCPRGLIIHFLVIYDPHTFLEMLLAYAM